MKRRTGVTLVELLVVIAIIAMLMGLLLPAVQVAREASRRAQCGNNARQLGLGCQTYASAHDLLPPGGDPSPRDGHGVSWIVWILPQLEQSAIYDRLDLIGDQAPTGQTGWVYQNEHNGEVVRGVRIPFLYCPSSDLPELVTPGRGDQLLSGSMFTGIAGARDDATARPKIDPGRAPGYVATSGAFRAHINLETPAGGTSCATLGAVPVADFRDGTSNTLLIGECSDWLVDPTTGEKTDLRPDCNHGFLMGNKCDHLGRMINLTVIAHRINEKSALAYGAMGNCGPNQPLRSPHVGGVDVTMADGSTRFLSDGTEFQVLCNLANRKDGKVISASDF